MGCLRLVAGCCLGAEVLCGVVVCAGCPSANFPHFDGGRVVVGGKETLGAYECSFSAYMCGGPPQALGLEPWAQIWLLLRVAFCL